MMKFKLGWLVFPLLPAPLLAQTTFYGDAVDGHMGEHFDVISDVNGDGIEDYIVGYPEDDSQGVDQGRVTILSGADGGVLRTHYGNSTGDLFGSRVCALGNIDGDGVPDYMVSAIEYGAGKGAVYVYSGATGVELHYLRGSGAGNRFGFSISDAGDMDQDGVDDFLVGAPGFGNTQISSWGQGAVYVLSGVNGAPIHTRFGFSNSRMGLGMYVDTMGDVNGDGVVDYIVAAPKLADPSQGGSYVYILSGADNSVIRYHRGNDDGHGSADHVGLGVSNAGDLDGDGVNDYRFGVIIWWWDNFFHEGQAIYAFSGATGAYLANNTVFYNQLPSFHPIEPTNVGDVNGDGVPDLAYMTPEDQFVHVKSGATGAEMAVMSAAESNTRFGTVIRGVADVNGDGRRDIAIGIPDLDQGAGQDSGAIRFFSVEDCPATVNYCTALANTTGLPARISSFGSTFVGVNDFVLRARDCPPNKPGLFFYGPTQISTPYADGTLCVGTGSTGYFRVQPAVVANANGVATQPMDNTVGIFGSGPGQLAAGSTWNFQFWYRDPQGGPAGFNFSDALEVTFCP